MVLRLIFILALIVALGSFIFGINACVNSSSPNKGWNLYIKTDYQADDFSHLEIDMNELFEGELLYMIESHKRRFVSPDVFMEIQLYNDGVKQPAFMDWSNMTLHCFNNNLTKLISTIALYVDLNYM